MSEKKLSKKEIIRELWLRGNLSFKLHKVQKELYEKFYSSDPNSISVWLLARQSGKSVLLGLLALEQAIRTPNSIIKLVTDTKVHIESIFEPIFNQLLEDAPAEVIPEYDKKSYKYKFRNGSQIQLAGTDNKHYERLRGQKSQLILVDEAGFCNDLTEVVSSVLLPTTTHTGGKIVLASTPPLESDHDFYSFIEEAEQNNRLTKKTIFDNPLLSSDVVDNIVKQMGGRESERFRREYLVELIRDSSTTVIPEFDDTAEREIVVDSYPRPLYYDNYVAMDLGGKDLTVVAFGYYDFKNQKIVIEDEIVMDFRKPGSNIKTLTEQITQKESDLWMNIQTNEVKFPYSRVSDINPIVTQEILVQSNYEMNFQQARKDDKQAAINHLRNLIQSRQIVILSKCKTIIRHIKNVRWKSTNDKTKFARSTDDGHYDGVDATIYLVRSVQFNKNPYPANYRFEGKEHITFYPRTDQSSNGLMQSKETTNNLDVFKALFKKKV
jgi:hypothetical protein